MVESVKNLGLYGVKVRKRKQLLIAGILQRRNWQRVKVEQLCVRWVDFGENEMLEGNSDGGFCTEPAVGCGLDDVLRRKWVRDGDGKDELLRLS